MAGQLIELVFDSVTAPVAEAMVQELVDAADEIRSVDIDGKSSASARDVVALTESCATLRFSAFALPEAGRVPDVALRLLKTGDDCYDVEINLDLDDVSAPSVVVSGLQRIARDMARRHAVSNYYAGLEPAADEETRFFTGESLGPLSLPQGDG